MPEDKHFVFLYTRLAAYFYQSVLSLLKSNPSFKATIISYSPDKNAPYAFASTERLVLKAYKEFQSGEEIREYTERYEISAIYVAGWTDAHYLQVIRHYKNKVPIILGMDNPWKGTLRQKIASTLYSQKLQSLFSHIWCPGMPQIEFARKLGFSYDQILTNLYVANTADFQKAYIHSFDAKAKAYPKRLLYLGRYVSYKQPLLLVQQFDALAKAEANNGWSLALTGAGPLKATLKTFESDYITVNDFVPPEALPEKLSEYGAFCLPSQNEHWGVVVHEAAAAGLPLLLSNTVYSGTAFLINGHNGWYFTANDATALKNALIELVNSSSKALLEMGTNSNRLSQKINHLDWQANLLSVFK